MRFLAALLCLATATSPALAQRVAGMVSSRGEPVPGVNVFIVETLEGALTDSTGRFSFATNARGEVTLQARRIGYRPHMRRISLDSTLTLTIELSP